MKKKHKVHPLFADLAAQQQVVKANMKAPTLEEARAIVKWLKTGKDNDRKKRQV